jgi:hypothetical protein
MKVAQQLLMLSATTAANTASECYMPTKRMSKPTTGSTRHAYASAHR